MPEYMYSENDVRKMWQRSYGEQIGVAQAKCIEVIMKTEGKLAVSFSGGKDSAVLLYLMAEIWSSTIYKNEPLQVMFANTTNEFTCMIPYVKFYCGYIEQRFNIKINLNTVQGDMNYFQVTDKVGMPFISKKVARMIRDVKRILHNLDLTYADIKDILPQHYTDKYYDDMLNSAEKLRKLGISNTVILYLTKVTSKNVISQQRFLPLQY